MPARIEWEAEDPNVPYREGWLYTLEGLKLAIRIWGQFDGKIRIIATHGWLDNLGSWDALIPLMLRRNADFCFACLEFSGHGRSQHIGPVLAMGGSDTHYYLQLLDLADALGWNTFSCLSHSMGSNASMFSAAIFPKRVLCITSVEGLGPLSWPASAVENLRDHVRGRQGLLDRDRKPQVFPTMEAAVQKVCRTYSLDLSGQMLASRPGATETTVRALIPRAIAPVEGGYTWTHDPTVHNPSAKRWTNPAMQVIMEAITCPILLVAGDKVPTDWRFDERIKLLRGARRLNLKGHHHLHIDNAEELAGPASAFFAQYGVQTTPALSAKL